jgi:hypothetical protein
MHRTRKIRLLTSAYLAARLGTSAMALAGVLTLLAVVVTNRRLPPWVLHTWEVAILVLAVSSVALYPILAWKR